ncbi:MAG: hypothetical protein ACFE0J_03645, partial [Elainellaceae cyanobacterium]
MNRPVGVIIIAVLQIVSSIFGIALGAIILIFGDRVIQWLAQTPEFQDAFQDIPTSFISTIAVVVGILSIVFGLLGILIAWGLLMLKLWAWVLTIVFQSLGAASNLVAVLTGQLSFGIIVQLAISALIIY